MKNMIFSCVCFCPLLRAIMNDLDWIEDKDDLDMLDFSGLACCSATTSSRKAKESSKPFFGPLKSPEQSEGPFWGQKCQKSNCFRGVYRGPFTLKGTVQQDFCVLVFLSNSSSWSHYTLHRGVALIRF